jgi:hypothetical protein
MHGSSHRSTGSTQRTAIAGQAKFIVGTSRAIAARPPRMAAKPIATASISRSCRMKTLLFATFSLFLLTGPAHAATAAGTAASDATNQIKRVIDNFQTAIARKDKAGLNALFLPANNSWIAVPAEETYRVVHAKHPKARRFMPGNYTEFVDFIAASPERMQEKFSNVKIETDGAVASVYFDFVFLANGRQQNHGSETWQLINTGNGWKINALVYSINVDPAQVK